MLFAMLNCVIFIFKWKRFKWFIITFLVPHNLYLCTLCQEVLHQCSVLHIQQTDVLYVLLWFISVPTNWQQKIFVFLNYTVNKKQQNIKKSQLDIGQFEMQFI